MKSAAVRELSDRIAARLGRADMASVVEGELRASMRVQLRCVCRHAESSHILGTCRFCECQCFRDDLLHPEGGSPS